MTVMREEIGFGASQAGPGALNRSAWSPSARMRAFGDASDPPEQRMNLPGEQGSAADRPADQPDPPDATVPGDVLRDAAQVAEQLALALRTLEERSPRAGPGAQSEAAEARLREALALLEAVRRVAQTVSSAELETLDRLLSAWVDRPTDLLILVKLAEQAGRLARIVSAFAEIHRMLPND